jgi:hypothetical protein
MMCEGNGKTNTLLLSQGRFFPKTETNASCFLCTQNDRSEVPGKCLNVMLEKVGESGSVVPDLPPPNGELNIILGQAENGSHIPRMKTDRYTKNSAVYLPL